MTVEGKGIDFFGFHNKKMDAISLLYQQTQDVHYWTNKIIAEIPEDKWFMYPDGFENNIAWQVGHILVSHHFHGIMAIGGAQPDLLAVVPIKRYSSFFAFGDNIDLVQEAYVSVPLLKEHLELVQAKTIEIIAGLQPEDLTAELEPIPVPHPIARTKVEALSWNIKHTMWHCGQIGSLMRKVHQPYDFKLQRPAVIPRPTFN